MPKKEGKRIKANKGGGGKETKRNENYKSYDYLT